MIALRDRGGVPHLRTADRETNGGGCGQPVNLRLGGINSLAATPSTGREHVGPQLDGTDRFKVSGKLQGCPVERRPRIPKGSGVGCGSGDKLLKLPAADQAHMFVKAPACDRGGCRARFGAPAAPAAVGELLHATGAAHQVAAVAADDKPGKQGGRQIPSALRPRHGLRGLPLAKCHQRLVGGRVDIRSEVQLTKVHPSLEHAAGSRPAKPNPAGQLADRRARSPVQKRPVNHLAHHRVGYQLAGHGVFEVADRDRRLPHPRLSAHPSTALKHLAGLLPQIRIDRRQQITLQPARRRRRINALPHNQHPAPRPLDALPRLKHHPQITAHPGQVCDRETAVPALLDPHDRLEECRPAHQWQTPTDIQFWRKQMHGVPPCPDRTLNIDGLVAHRMKPVGTNVPAADMRHSDHTRPQHARALYADTTPGTTTRPVSSIDREQVV